MCVSPQGRRDSLRVRERTVQRLVGLAAGGSLCAGGLLHHRAHNPGNAWHALGEIHPGRFALKLLGGGRRYEAYLAWNDELLCPTVVKMIRPNLVADERARNAVVAEASALDCLEHPSFVRLLSSDVNGPRPYVELEFLDFNPGGQYVGRLEQPATVVHDFRAG
jgi:hypothetical protein